MIEISNLRKYTRGALTRLEVDINFIDAESPYSERTLYFEIDKKFSYMFADDTYDAFVLVPLYLAMLSSGTCKRFGAIFMTGCRR